jgi:hypothetical protein
MKNVFLIPISLVLLSCSHSTSVTDGTFAIYLLQDSTVTARDAFSQPIESLTLTPSPFLSIYDLKSYFWSTHALELKDQPRAMFEQFQLSHGSTRGVPFVVTVGPTRIYLGTFWWAYSSSMPPACAVIEVIAPLPYRIQLANGAADKRGDWRIYVSLKASGVLVE